MKDKIQISIKGVKMHVKNNRVITTTKTLTRPDVIKLFKKYSEVDRINEPGGWWDRRTFAQELKQIL